MASHDAHTPPSARLRQMLRSEKQDLWAAVVYSVVIGLMSLVVPLVTQLLVNTVAFGTVLQPIVILTAVVLIALGFSALLQALRAIMVEIIQRRLFVRTGADVVNRLLRARADVFDRQYAPELINRFFDVVTVQKSSALLLIDGLSLAMQTLLGMALLAVYHPWLLAFDLFLLATILFVLLVMGRGAVPTAISESYAKYAVVAWMEDTARHLLTFKTPRAAAFAVARADGLLAHWVAHRSAHFRIVLRQITGFLILQAVASAVLLGVGSWLVLERQLTIGQLVAAELVVAAILSALAKYGKYLETYYDLVAATDKLGHLQDFPLEREGGEELSAPHKGMEIRLEGVTYDYPGRPAVIDGVTWQVEPGRHIGLTGGSGHGKTTLLELLYGLRTASRGAVELDGLDIRQISLDSLRSRMALVRGADVFNGTIEENLCLGDSSVPAAEIRRALASVGLLDEIRALPDGLQTELAPGGRPLSAGQAVRLTLARAILGKPRLLILDEALDQFDDALERDLVLEVLFDPRAPWTVLAATEAADVLRRCDEVYVLENGKLRQKEGSKLWK